MKKIKYTLSLLMFGLLFAQSNIAEEPTFSDFQISSERYLTDEKGNIIKIQNPAWNDFKAGIGNVMPRIGDVDPVEKIPQYDDYFNSNKTNVDFSEGFVDTILGYHDAEFAKRETEKENKQGDVDKYYKLIGKK